MSGFDQHIPITPPSLKESNSISTPVVSHSSKNEDNRNDIMSPMKDWNMFYDDTNDVILYQNPFGDELTIKDKIHNEIEKFIRGDDEIDIACLFVQYVQLRMDERGCLGDLLHRVPHAGQSRLALTGKPRRVFGDCERVAHHVHELL